MNATVQELVQLGKALDELINQGRVGCNTAFPFTYLRYYAGGIVRELMMSGDPVPLRIHVHRKRRLRDWFKALPHSRPDHENTYLIIPIAMCRYTKGAVCATISLYEEALAGSTRCLTEGASDD